MTAKSSVGGLYIESEFLEAVGVIPRVVPTALWGGGRDRDRGSWVGAKVTDTLHATRGTLNFGQPWSRGRDPLLMTIAHWTLPSRQPAQHLPSMAPRWQGSSLREFAQRGAGSGTTILTQTTIQGGRRPTEAREYNRRARRQ